MNQKFVVFWKENKPIQMSHEKVQFAVELGPECEFLHSQFIHITS